tara:strand:- start:195 stop:377 length:183 start_codon:yes stop_codon:yes gene_type:complete
VGDNKIITNHNLCLGKFQEIVLEDKMIQTGSCKTDKDAMCSLKRKEEHYAGNVTSKAVPV